MRYIEKYITQDLKEKMVFLWWARQVGKTTLSLSLSENNYKKYTYLNWDNIKHRKKIISGEYDFDSEIIIFDEIHKYSKWKSHLKWEYDVLKNKYKFLITWSARLDIYQKWWDSMLWRYYYYRLHPFSLAELVWIENNFENWLSLVFRDNFYKKKLDILIKFWWFPEVLFKQNIRTLSRWKKDRIKRIVYEDIRDLSNIKYISTLEILASILHTKVASVFSINSLVEDLQVTNKTITNWINILEKVYYCHKIYPYYKSELKSLKKEAKIYLIDYTEVSNIWARNENIIANSLLKFVNFLEDVFGYNIQLKYLRDKEKREVDFVITMDWKVKYLIEVKTNNTKVSKNLLYFKKLLWVKECFQVVFSDKNIDVETKWIRIISASKFLTWLV